jgi:hypothetical protein
MVGLGITSSIGGKAMASEKQIQANRKNGLKGGAKTSNGKAISRLNARRHSIFTSALTPEDAKDLYVIEDQLIATLRPVGRVEEMLVEKLALTYLRMQRCARAEAEYHMLTWEEPNSVMDQYEWDLLIKKHRLGARASPFRPAKFASMVELIDLYDARLTNQFLRLLHEIERQQRLRAGEKVPPPVIADLAIHTDAGSPRERDAALQPEVSTPAHDVQSSSSALADGPQKSQDPVTQSDNAQAAT